MDEATAGTAVRPAVDDLVGRLDEEPRTSSRLQRLLGLAAQADADGVPF